MNDVAIDYEKLKDEALAELDELYNNPAVNAAMHMTLPNTAEETDYALWEECFRDTLTRHDAILRDFAERGFADEP